MTADAVRILRDAATILEQKGWTQGMAYNIKTKEFDLEGAIAHAAGVTIKTLAVTDMPLDECANGIKPAVSIALDELEAHLHADITEWNDAPHRTQQQVVQALTAAATALYERSIITRPFVS